SDATLRAAVLFGPDVVAHSLQTPEGYARRSRLVWAKNPSPQTWSDLWNGVLSLNKRRIKESNYPNHPTIGRRTGYSFNAPHDKGHGMTAKGVLLAAGPALLGLVAGLVMGRNWDQHAAAPSAASHANATHSNGTKNLKPPLPGKPPTRPMEPVRFAAAGDLARTMTIDEVSVAIQTAL